MLHLCAPPVKASRGIDSGVEQSRFLGITSRHGGESAVRALNTQDEGVW
jgi:hypothetical protein